LNALVTAIEPKGSWFHGQSDQELLDAFILQQQTPWLGTRFQTLGEAWRQCSWPEAESLVQTLTTVSLAYGAQFEPGWIGPVAPLDFLSRFERNARLYTNVAEDQKSWMPATTATFDRGIGAIDDDLVGIVWGQDED
jgi:hypothetical protein